MVPIVVMLIEYLGVALLSEALVTVGLLRARHRSLEVLHWVPHGFSKSLPCPGPSGHHQLPLQAHSHSLGAVFLAPG